LVFHGRSNAFAISKKLGLDDNIIKRAESFLDTDQIHVEELLKSIYDDKLWIENEKEQIEKNSNQISLLRKSLEEREKSLKETYNSYIDKAKQDARKILLDVKDEASYYISKINEIYENASSNSVKDLNQIRNKLNESLKETSTNAIYTKESASSVEKEDLKVGCTVYIGHLNQQATILNITNKSNQVQVQIGSAKLMLPISSITKVISSQEKTFTGSSNYKTNKTKTATSEINVIGYNVDEAVFVIDKYLDDCVLAKLNTVRIVHGKGTGALMKGIHSFLKTNSHIKSFRLGTFGEGEMGVTVVELR
jgi:DNA mismatch repair protein MutS2